MFFRGMSHPLVSPARSTRIFGSFPLLPSVRSWHCNAELLGSSSRLQNGSANEVWELSSVQNTGWLMNIGDHTTQYIENCNNPLEECLFINQDRKTEGFWTLLICWKLSSLSARSRVLLKFLKLRLGPNWPIVWTRIKVCLWKVLTGRKVVIPTWEMWDAPKFQPLTGKPISKPKFWTKHVLFKASFFSNSERCLLGNFLELDLNNVVNMVPIWRNCPTLFHL